MNKNINKPDISQGEIVIYQPTGEENVQIEVRVEDESVWLNRHQLATLFDRDVKTIGKHISNAFKEELNSIPVVAKFATTAADGKKYQVEYYNLDMIISIGYRVKSKRGNSIPYLVQQSPQGLSAKRVRCQPTDCEN